MPEPASAATVTYRHEDDELAGYLVADTADPRPGVLLIHDAMGVSEPMKAIAHRIAELGNAVLLIDLWGEGQTPGEDQIGPLIGSMVNDPERWMGRIRAGHDALRGSAGVSDLPVTAVGYCFGGSSALEYLRHGGEVGGVVTFHAGLDTVGGDWSHGHAQAKVLVLTGAEDPMAPREALETLQDGLATAGVEWEVAVYGDTRHGFTNPHADRAGRPDAIAYNARADRRSWESFSRFLEKRHDGHA